MTLGSDSPAYSILPHLIPLCCNPMTYQIEYMSNIMHSWHEMKFNIVYKIGKGSEAINKQNYDLEQEVQEVSKCFGILSYRLCHTLNSISERIHNTFNVRGESLEYVSECCRYRRNGRLNLRVLEGIQDSINKYLERACNDFHRVRKYGGHYLQHFAGSIEYVCQDWDKCLANLLHKCFECILQTLPSLLHILNTFCLLGLLTLILQLIVPILSASNRAHSPSDTSLGRR